MAGAALGSVVTWKIVSDRYEEIVQEELDSIRESFSQDDEEFDDEDVEELEVEEKIAVQNDGDDEDKPTIKEYAKKVKQMDYSSFSVFDSEKANKEKEGVQMSMDEVTKPYVIDINDFGDNEDYKTVSLTYYANGVLVEDDTSKVITDIEGTIGEESLSHFGEYMRNIVNVCNDELETYFEIFESEDEYEED